MSPEKRKVHMAILFADNFLSAHLPKPDRPGPQHPWIEMLAGHLADAWDGRVGPEPDLQDILGRQMAVHAISTIREGDPPAVKAVRCLAEAVAAVVVEHTPRARYWTMEFATCVRMHLEQVGSMDVNTRKLLVAAALQYLEDEPKCLRWPAGGAA